MTNPGLFVPIFVMAWQGLRWNSSLFSFWTLDNNTIFYTDES